MFKTVQKSQKRASQRLPIFLGALLLACSVLLSACNGMGATSANASSSLNSAPTVALTPSSTVSASLQKQGTLQLQTYQEWIALMKQYNGKVSQYQQKYTSDQQALSVATTDSVYQKALNTLSGHISEIKLPALKTEALSLQKQLSDEADAWSSKHTYYDSYDGVTYHLGYEYQNVVYYPAQGLLDASETASDYQYIIEQLHVWLANFEAYKANFSDKTPYNQVHQTDKQLISRYGYTSGKVLVVSFSEQAMRVYQDGKLINAFQVVTGMPAHPSLPGTWWIETRQTNIEFTSGKKPDEEGYYPPTPIAYAMQYHSGGYFIHESWWRSQYGPGNQFPHNDPHGTGFAFAGSHGCVNMSTETVAWVYNFVDVNTTRIIMY